MPSMVLDQDPARVSDGQEHALEERRRCDESTANTRFVLTSITGGNPGCYVDAQ